MPIECEEHHIEVIMVGPSLSSRGGMTSVVKGYYSAGLQDKCNLTYIETTSPGGIFHKITDFFNAYRSFCEALPHAQIVHLHIGAGVSQSRKKFFARKAKKAGKRIVIHEHRGVLAELCRQKGEKFIQSVRKFYALADSVVVLSEEWKKFFVDNICDGNKITVLHNGVLPPEEVQPSFHAKQVLFLGHMTSVKGPDVMIEAASSVLDKCSDAKFVFAGDGSADEYEKMAVKLGIANSCTFTGWVDEDARDRLLRSSSVYCQPSRNEGMPMGLLEAMGYSLPPVATKVGGVPEVISSGENGILVESEDITALSQQLMHLLTNEKMWNHLSSSARETVLRDFNCANAVSRLMSLYTALARRIDINNSRE